MCVCVCVWLFKHKQSNTINKAPRLELEFKLDNTLRFKFNKEPYMSTEEALNYNFANVSRKLFVFLLDPVAPDGRSESVCERWRANLIDHYGGKPGPQQYLPQCEPDGQFRYDPKLEVRSDACHF